MMWLVLYVVIGAVVGRMILHNNSSYDAEAQALFGGIMWPIIIFFCFIIAVAVTLDYGASKVGEGT